MCFYQTLRMDVLIPKKYKIKKITAIIESKVSCVLIQTVVKPVSNIFIEVLNLVDAMKSGCFWEFTDILKLSSRYVCIFISLKGIFCFYYA